MPEETKSRKPETAEAPKKIGVTSDNQPDLVPASGANERDHGGVDDRPMAGDTVNLDDDELTHPRGNVSGRGRTWEDKKPSDAGEIAPPDVGMSDRNGPSDRGNR